MGPGLGAIMLAVTMALGMPPGTAPAKSTTQAHWRLDNAGSPKRAFDSSRFKNHGKNQDVVGTGRGYKFNGKSSRVIVPDSRSLDPRTKGFAFGVTLVLRKPPAEGETYDVLRKGLASTKGGNYKLEITREGDAARARCLVRDSARNVATISARRDLADGKPHSITCRKTSRGVSVRIDHRPPRFQRVPSLGSVSNANRLGLGGKAEPKATTGFDWLKGRIDNAWVRVVKD